MELTMHSYIGHKKCNWKDVVAKVVFRIELKKPSWRSLPASIGTEYPTALYNLLEEASE